MLASGSGAPAAPTGELGNDGCHVTGVGDTHVVPSEEPGATIYVPLEAAASDGSESDSGSSRADENWEDADVVSIAAIEACADYIYSEFTGEPEFERRIDALTKLIVLGRTQMPSRLLKSPLQFMIGADGRARDKSGRKPHVRLPPAVHRPTSNTPTPISGLFNRPLSSMASPAVLMTSPPQQPARAWRDVRFRI